MQTFGNLALARCVALFCMLFGTRNGYGELNLYYLATEPGRESEAGYGSENPFRALYKKKLDSGESHRVMRDSFEDVTQGHFGNRLFLRKLFVDPETQSVMVAGLRASVQWIPPIEFSRNFELRDGGMFSRNFTSPATLEATPVSHGTRILQLWDVNGGQVLPHWSQALPLPADLEGGTSAISLSKPTIQIEALSYSFTRDEAYLPFTETIHSLSSDALVNLTPGVDFYRMTDSAGGGGFLGGSIPSFSTSVVDDRHGHFYVSYRAQEVRQVTLRKQVLYENEETVGSPHIIVPEVLRTHDEPRGPQDRIARFNFRGEQPIAFDSSGETVLQGHDLVAIDPYAGLLFAGNLETGTLFKRPLNRPDTSAQAKLSADLTGTPEFAFEEFGASTGKLSKLQADPASRRLFYLVSSGGPGPVFLYSIAYDGTAKRLETSLPASTVDFVVSNSESLLKLPERASYLPIDDLAHGNGFLTALDVSADGSVIAGISTGGDETSINPSSISTRQPYLASQSGASFGLGFPRKHPSLVYDAAPSAISGDGKVLALSSQIRGLNTRPATWSARDGFLNADDYGEDFLSSIAALNFDGTVFGGTNRSLPAYWSQVGGIKSLPLPSAENRRGYINAISHDGTRFAGRVEGPGDFREAFLYTEADGYTFLGDLPGGIFMSYAHAISPNGQLVAGLSYVGFEGFDIAEAFIWSALDGMTGIGSLNPESTFGKYSEARDVNDDRVAVGSSGTKAFIYHPLTGMLSLTELLRDGYGFEEANCIDAVGVSDDGKTVIGKTLQGAFVATLPNFPADALLLSASLSTNDDSDGDGQSDFFEAAMGTDPFSSESMTLSPLRVSQSAGSTTVTLGKPPIAASGLVSYVIEEADSLVGPWSAEGLTVIEETNEILRVSSTLQSRKFFRLVIQQDSQEQ